MKPLSSTRRICRQSSRIRHAISSSVSHAGPLDDVGWIVVAQDGGPGPSGHIAGTEHVRTRSWQFGVARHSCCCSVVTALVGQPPLVLSSPEQAANSVTSSARLTRT